MLAAVGLLLFLVPAVLSTPALAVLTQSLPVKRHKTFYDKCARQMTQLCFGLALFLFCVLGAGAAFFLVQYQPEYLEPPLLRQSAVALVPPAAVLVGLALYLGTWNALKKWRWAHLCLGFLAALLCLTLFFLGFLLLSALQQPVIRGLLLTAPFKVLHLLILDYLASPTLWLVSSHFFCTGIAVGTGLAQLWLFIRRYKADYGRDYYVFAVRYCARFALAFTLLATTLAGFTFWRIRESFPPELSQPQDIGILLISFGLPLSCCLLWLCVIKSDNPLRHKPGVFFACLFLYIALCAQMLSYINTFPLI